MRRSRKFSQGVLKLFKSSLCFTVGCRDLPREAIGPKGSNCFSRGVHTSISKKTYSNLCFSRWVGLDPCPPPPLDQSMGYTSQVATTAGALFSYGHDAKTTLSAYMKDVIAPDRLKKLFNL